MPSRRKVVPMLIASLILGIGLFLVLRPPYKHSAPTGLRVLGRTPTAVTLAWNPIPGVKRYRVHYSERRDMVGGGSKAYAINAGPLVSLTAARKYYIRVAAISTDSKSYLSPWSKQVVTATKAPPVAVKVGSFNISDPKNGNWGKRRKAIAEDIQSENIDVLGVQEAYGDGDRSSLLDAVNEVGRRDRKRQFVMVYPVHDIRGKDNRILYDDKRVDLINIGYEEFDKQAPDGKGLGSGKDYERDMIWATFRERAYNHRFLFVSTHLSPSPYPEYDHAQWKQLIYRITRLNSVNNPHLPVIVVGDFNTSKFQLPGNSMINKMAKFGYSDVLGQRYGTHELGHPRAKTRIDAWLGSFNGYRRSTRSYRVLRDHIGDNIDWIFATNTLPVQRWRTVAHHKDGRLVGTIASDHFLVTSTIVLP